MPNPRLRFAIAGFLAVLAACQAAPAHREKASMYRNLGNPEDRAAEYLMALYGAIGDSPH